jgi:acyl carrier protein
MASKAGEEVGARLRSFVMRRYLPDRKEVLSDDDALFSSGVIDSLGLVDLTCFIEEQFDVFLGPDELGAGRADTLGQVAALVENSG